MRILLFTPLALCLMAFKCGGDTYRPAAEFPSLPPLSAETVAQCPPAPDVTSYADLIAKDAQLAFEYGKCEARRATAVGAYQEAQRLLSEAAAKANARPK